MRLVRLACVIVPILLCGCGRQVTDATAGYPRNCDVHGTALRPRIVRYTGGIQRDDLVPAWATTRDAQFPYAGVVSGSGCGHEPQLMRVKFCPDCRRTRSEWLRDPRHSYEAMLVALREQQAEGKNGVPE